MQAPSFTWGAAQNQPAVPAQAPVRNQPPAPAVSQPVYHQAPVQSAAPPSAAAGSKPWEHDTHTASYGAVRNAPDSPGGTPEQAAKPTVFRLSPEGQNSINRIPIGNTFLIVIGILLILWVNSKIKEHTDLYYEFIGEVNPIPYYKIVRIAFVFFIIDGALNLIGYLVNRDALEQTRCEIRDNGISIFYVTNTCGIYSRHFVELTWANIFSAQVAAILSSNQLALRFRDPYTLKMRGALLKIENPHACADIIRQRAGLQSDGKRGA
ncbi:MAG: hypothetical protein IJ060_05190 [Oscillospiraceae bacterium]|nr:hypothetical protein [Oscillospiraceae bacterium]